MKIRIARHTQTLEPLTDFYTNILDLKITGYFKNHSNYNGVFLSNNENWELEFTTSKELPNHTFDEDDLLIFYLPNKLDYLKKLELIKNKNIPIVKPKNPYWENNAVTLLDPDKNRIVITYKEKINEKI